jgi:hypothetical protein
MDPGIAEGVGLEPTLACARWFPSTFQEGTQRFSGGGSIRCGPASGGWETVRDRLDVRNGQWCPAGMVHTSAQQVRRVPPSCLLVDPPAGHHKPKVRWA